MNDDRVTIDIMNDFTPTEPVYRYYLLGILCLIYPNIEILCVICLFAENFA